MDLNEYIVIRIVDGLFNGRTRDVGSVESGSVACCGNVQALQPLMNALQSAKLSLELELLGLAKPLECSLTCSLLAVYKYCTKPWTNLHPVACRTDILN